MIAGLVKLVAALGSSGLGVLSSCVSFVFFCISWALEGQLKGFIVLGLSGIRAWSFYAPRPRGFILGLLCSQGVTLG